MLIDGLLARYRATFREEHYGGIWKTFFDRYQRPLHKVFMDGSPEAAEKILRNPMENYLRFGYDCLYKGHSGQINEDLALLRRLASALGAIPLPNPEAPKTIRYRFGMWLRRRTPSTAEGIINSIERITGRIDFPNPYPGEWGLFTSKGVASYRALHAVYQAKLLSGKVVEIGGGLGRVAYYAKKFGISDYTIVDLPFTSIAQGHYLGSVLGESAGVRLISPDEFFDSSETYDVALNVDSITEMDFGTAKHYASELKKRASRIISINHEANLFFAKDLFGSGRRYPYWLRDGYVEEHF